jgi:hypothetical protein
MVLYQFRFHDNDGRLIGKENHPCSDDLEALDLARILSHRHAVEIWDGEQRIARVKIGDRPPSVTDREPN